MRTCRTCDGSIAKGHSRYGLRLHREKTKIICMGDEIISPDKTFDFRGIAHDMGRSRKGKRVLKRPINRKKLRASLKRVSGRIKRSWRPRLIDLVDGLSRRPGAVMSMRVSRFNAKWMERSGNSPDGVSRRKSRDVRFKLGYYLDLHSVFTRSLPDSRAFRAHPSLNPEAYGTENQT